MEALRDGPNCWYTETERCSMAQDTIFTVTALRTSNQGFIYEFLITQNSSYYIIIIIIIIIIISVITYEGFGNYGTFSNENTDRTRTFISD
jgi:hypothetical protein